MIAEPKLTIGVEEEYLLVDRETRDLVADPHEELMRACERALGPQVSPEFLKAQIEVGTKVHETVAGARADLAGLRGFLAETAAKYDYAIIAASTHPFARWSDQHHTPKERYDDLARDLGGAVRRLLICGCHVHAGVEDPDLRIDLMNQVAYFLPHLLALSTSSPYWQGTDTGLASYRLTVFDALPRTGMPEIFDSFGQYERFVNQLISAGGVQDGSKIWWDIRPSAKFPTLEMRVADVCTRLDDAITIAALYQGLLAMLYRLRLENQRWRIYPRTLIRENRWRAQRYGAEGELVDFGRNELAPYGELLEELIELCAPGDERFGFMAELEHARDIIHRGTSARRQREVYKGAIDGGASKQDALKKVVDFLIEETVVGV